MSLNVKDGFLGGQVPYSDFSIAGTRQKLHLELEKGKHALQDFSGLYKCTKLRRSVLLESQ